MLDFDPRDFDDTRDRGQIRSRDERDEIEAPRGRRPRARPIAMTTGGNRMSDRGMGMMTTPGRSGAARGTTGKAHSRMTTRGTAETMHAGRSATILTAIGTLKRRSDGMFTCRVARSGKSSAIVATSTRCAGQNR
jgi:hypothetical protein